MDDEITCEVEGSEQGVKELQLLSGRRTNRSRDRQPSDCIMYVGGMSVVTLQDAVLCRPFQC